MFNWFKKTIPEEIDIEQDIQDSLTSKISAYNKEHTNIKVEEEIDISDYTVVEIGGKEVRVSKVNIESTSAINLADLLDKDEDK